MNRLDQTIERETRRNSIKHFLRDKFVLAKQFESENGRKGKSESFSRTHATSRKLEDTLDSKQSSSLYAVQWKKSSDEEEKEKKITIIYF